MSIESNTKPTKRTSAKKIRFNEILEKKDFSKEALKLMRMYNSQDSNFHDYLHNTWIPERSTTKFTLLRSDYPDTDRNVINTAWTDFRRNKERSTVTEQPTVITQSTEISETPLPGLDNLLTQSTTDL